MELPVQSLPIACAIDQNYLVPLALMLKSLQERLRPGVRPILYLLHRGIPSSSLEAFSGTVELHPIAISPDSSAAAVRDSHFPPEASFPLLLADVLPAHCQRVLFLDVDLMVMDDLQCLWETPLDGCVVGAVADSAIPLCSSPRAVKDCSARGIPINAPYFNAGVLLIDLTLWREREITRRCRDYLESTGNRVDFLHQEALNAVLWDGWKPLDARWNILASHAGRPYGRIPTETWKRPGIVHFAGRFKPWRAPVGGPFGAAYRDMLEHVPPPLHAAPTTGRERLNSVYDRYFRSFFYPLEHLLWRNRLI